MSGAKAVALGLLGALAVALLPAAPASAASSGDVLLSVDGASWSTSLDADVFQTAGALVPGDVVRGTFYVKNGRDSPAYLRLGLSALTVTSWDLAQALNLTTIGTTSDGASGSAASFAGPDVVCTDLLHRADPIQPGGVVLVTADLRFRSTTSATEAQGEIARIGFIAELSDIDLSTTGTRLCTGALTIGPVAPTGRGATGPGGSGDGSAGGSGDSSSTVPSGGGSTPGDTGGAQPEPDRAETVGGTPATGSASGVISAGDPMDPAGIGNTVRWWEEYAILVLIGAAMVGMLLRLGVQRRLEQADGDES